MLMNQIPEEDEDDYVDEGAIGNRNNELKDLMNKYHATGKYN